MHRRHFTGPARAMRGVVLGSALFVLTIGGHTTTDGGSHDLARVLWLLPLMILLSATLAERRRSTVWLVAYLVGAQAFFHAVLAVSLGHGGLATSIVPSAPMGLAHVAIAMVTALALHYADDLLHRWLAFADALTHGPSVEIAPLAPWPALAISTALFADLANDGEPWRRLRAPPLLPA